MPYIIPMKSHVFLLAYIDPGSGSMLLQMLLGGVAGVAVAVRMYWHRLRGLLRIPFEKHAGRVALSSTSTNPRRSAILRPASFVTTALSTAR